MRRRRGRSADVEEGESYYVSMTDMMVGVIFIFIIMLSYFAFEFRSTTVKLKTSKQPETAALLADAAALEPRNADIEIDYAARVLCVPETVLSKTGDGVSGERRCFSFSPPAKASAQAVSVIDAQSLLLEALAADLRDAKAPLQGPVSNDTLAFKTSQIFQDGTATLSPDGQRIAGQVAQALARRLPCLGYGAPAGAGCDGGEPKLAVVNVVGQTSLDAFTPEGQQAAALALQRAVAFHRALTAAQPMLATLRNVPVGQTGSQPLLRVASVGQSQEAASKVGDDQTVSIQFRMADN